MAASMLMNQGTAGIAAAQELWRSGTVRDEKAYGYLEFLSRRGFHPDN
jgi:hypothetical protein